MIATDLARRYALAFFESALENKELEAGIGQLKAFVDTLFGDSEALAFFISPVHSRESKIKVIGSAFEGKLLPILLNFLYVIIDHDRASELEAIVAAVQERSDDSRGAKRGKLYLSSSISDETLIKIEGVVSKAMGQKVNLVGEIDPTILGGFRAQVGGWTFDDSFISHLNRIKEDVHRRAE